MAIILFDNTGRDKLQPFTLTKAVSELRAGIFTNRERWGALTGEEVFVQTTGIIQQLYPSAPQGEHLWIDAAVLPTGALLSVISSLKYNAAVKDRNGLVAAKGDWDRLPPVFNEMQEIETVKRFIYPWHLMQWNDEIIREDYKLVTKGKTSRAVPSSVNTINPENIFVEEGAKLSFCTLNASTGPIYIGKNAEVMEGSCIRGPFVLGENAVLKMNSRVYGATTLGPSCMGGGEIKNAVMMGHSNKAHDGYLGDSVVGEWCNFGAGSSNSNIKNTAGEVKVWSMSERTYMPVAQKCGVIMGDYSRVAINSSINTGTVIGVSANVFGAGLLPTIIGNFKWGVTGISYEFEKAMSDIDNWKNLKGQSLTDVERSILQAIFEANS